MAIAHHQPAQTDNTKTLLMENVLHAQLVVLGVQAHPLAQLVCLGIIYLPAVAHDPQLGPTWDVLIRQKDTVIIPVAVHLELTPLKLVTAYLALRLMPGSSVMLTLCAMDMQLDQMVEIIS